MPNPDKKPTIQKVTYRDGKFDIHVSDGRVLTRPTEKSVQALIKSSFKDRVAQNVLRQFNLHSEPEKASGSDANGEIEVEVVEKTDIRSKVGKERDYGSEDDEDLLDGDDEEEGGSQGNLSHLPAIFDEDDEDDTTITELKSFMTAISRGAPVAPDMLSSVRRMTTRMEARLSLLDTVRSHHLVHRLGRMESAIKGIESILFSPIRMAVMENKDLIRLFDIVLKEAHSLANQLSAKTERSVEEMEAALKEAPAETGKEANARIKSLSTQAARSRARAILTRMLSPAALPPPSNEKVEKRGP